jgi:hypothetical protein
MVYIRIVKSPNNLKDRIDRADMSEELVPESLPLGGSLYESCDIDEFDGCWDYFGTIHDFSDLFESFIIHIYYTSIGFDSTKWKIGSLSRIRLGESIEECGFTDIWETDDTDLHFLKVRS